MNFNDYLIKEGLKHDHILEMLIKEGVDPRSIDEGILDKLRPLKKAVMGTMVALLLAKGAMAGQMDDKQVDFFASSTMDVITQEYQELSDLPDEYKGAGLDGILTGVNDALNSVMDKGEMDQDDKDKILDKIGEELPDVAKSLQDLDDKDGHDGGNAEGGVDNSKPWDSTEPEDWAKKFVDSTKNVKGSAANFKLLDQLGDIKDAAQKAGQGEWFSSVVDTMSTLGFNYNG
jgi:hypothetical protein